MNHTPTPWRVSEKLNNATSIAMIQAHFDKDICSLAAYEMRHCSIDETNANAERIVQCVNAMDGIENPADFVTIAKANHNTNIAWERTMKELLDEDGLGSVRKSIENLKKQSMVDIKESDRDNLCDMLWWMRGYKKGADDNLETCPFGQDHLDTLDKLVRSLREVLNSKKS